MREREITWSEARINTRGAISLRSKPKERIVHYLKRGVRCDRSTKKCIENNCRDLEKCAKRLASMQSPTVPREVRQKEYELPEENLRRRATTSWEGRGTKTKKRAMTKKRIWRSHWSSRNDGASSPSSFRAEGWASLSSPPAIYLSSISVIYRAWHCCN